MSSCASTGLCNNNIKVVSLTNGSTLKNISVAIKIEQIGSAMFQPKFSINKVEKMTPTLPNVSARTCRNTPVITKI